MVADRGIGNCLMGMFRLGHYGVLDRINDDWDRSRSGAASYYQKSRKN
jgi:hypothetical protein